MFKHALTHDVAYSTLLLERRKALAPHRRRRDRGAVRRPAGRALRDARPPLHAGRGVEKGARSTSRSPRRKATASFANREAFDFARSAIEICERLGDDRLVASPRARRPRSRPQLVHSARRPLRMREAFQRMVGNRAATGRHGDARAGLAAASMVELYEHDLERAERDGAERPRHRAERRAMLDVAHATAKFDDAVRSCEVTDRPRSRRSPNSRRVRSCWPAAVIRTDQRHGGRDRRSRTSWEALPERKRHVTKRLNGPRHLMGSVRTWVEGMTRVVASATISRRVDTLSRGRPVRGDGSASMLMYLQRAQHRSVSSMATFTTTRQALEWNQRGLKEALDAGLPDPEVECNAALNVGDNLMALGRIDEAEERYAWVEAIYRDPDTRAELHALALRPAHAAQLRRAKLLRGDHDKALSFADECLDLAQRSDSPKNVDQSSPLRGQVVHGQGKLDEAPSRARSGGRRSRVR